VQGPGCVAEMAASRKEAIRNFADSLWFPADRGRDPGSYQWVGHFFSVWFRSANFTRERGGQRASVFVSAHFSRHPAL